MNYNGLRKLEGDLNILDIQARIGLSKLLLNERAISEIIEKHAIGILSKYYHVEASLKGKPYDLIIHNGKSVFINIKTESKSTSVKHDAIWMCSESVLRKMSKELQENLYYILIEYLHNRSIKVINVSIAGPANSIMDNIIVYDKVTSEMTNMAGIHVKFKICKFYNGIHAYILKDAFKKLEVVSG